MPLCADIIFVDAPAIDVKESRGKNVLILVGAVLLTLGGVYAIMSGETTMGVVATIFFLICIPFVWLRVSKPSHLVADDTGITETSPPRINAHHDWASIERIYSARQVVSRGTTQEYIFLSVSDGETASYPVLLVGNYPKKRRLAEQLEAMRLHYTQQP